MKSKFHGRLAPSLSASLAAATFVGTFLLSGLLVVLDYHRQKAAAREEVYTDAANLAGNLRYPVQMLLVRQDHGMLRSVLESAAGDRRVKQALLIDRRQRILAAHRSDVVGREVQAVLPEALPLIQRALKEKRPLYQPLASDSLYLALMPISTTAEQYFQTEAAAVLLLAFDTTFLDARLKTQLSLSLLTHALNGTIFALLIFLILEQVVATPIRRLAKALRQVQGGDLRARVRIPRVIELGEVAHAFNELVLRLRAYYEELQRQHRELEALHHTAERMKEQYRQLVELAQEGILIADANELIRYVNPAFARSLGYAEEELIGRSILTLIPEEDRPRVTAETEKRRRGESSRYEVRMRTKEGELRDFLIAAAPLWDETGTFAGALAVTVDITELRRKEEALRRSEERYSDLYNNAPDGYHTLAPDGTFLEINETELRWLGYRREEVIGRLTFGDVLDERSRRIFEHALASLKEEGTVRELELEMVRRDGTHFAVRVNMTVEGDEQGALRYRATVRDVTEQKSLEKQLMHAQKLESIGALAGGIAHDFNNLLTGMLGFTELALRELGPQDPRRELLQNVLTLGQRGARLVRQLLTFSRRIEVHRTTLDVREFLKEMVGLLQRVLPETIAVRLDVSEPIGSLEADPVGLQQVLMNLAVNARDAMPDGGTLTISCAPVTLAKPGVPPLPPDAPPGAYVRLSVADTGIGMTPEVQARIFEPFFTTKEVGKGSGLGLSVVYGIVRAHGGFITVESAPGLGSRFDLYLPLTERAAIPRGGGSTTPLIRGADELILLADDEPVLLDLEEKVLRAHGYRVLKARDGQEALRLYEDHQREIAAIVLDALMPGVTGIEAARRIRERDARARILLVTGYNPEESGLGGIRVENVHILQKPYTPRQLLETIGHLLGKSQQAPLPA